MQISAAGSVDAIEAPAQAPGRHTVCPGNSDPFYIVTYFIKWVTTSWTYSTYCEGTASCWGLGILGEHVRGAVSLQEVLH